MFEDDVCVDLSGVLDGKPNYANILFLELFARPYVDQLEIMNEGPNYAATFLLELCAKARFPPVMTLSRVATVKVYG